MVIGVDFDNTIVRYDQVFHRLAVERGWIPPDLALDKNAVRDYLRGLGRERDWTELQGQVYGPAMAEAQPFAGVLGFFARARRAGVPLFIISHKTPVPVIGPPHDLHQTARDWLEAKGFFEPATGLPRHHVLFGATREEKVLLLTRQHCTHFVDDLEETFREPAFPSGVVKILFGKNTPPDDLAEARPALDWAQVTRYVFPE